MTYRLRGISTTLENRVAAPAAPVKDHQSCDEWCHLRALLGSPCGHCVLRLPALVAEDVDDAGKVIHRCGEAVGRGGGSPGLRDRDWPTARHQERPVDVALTRCGCRRCRPARRRVKWPRTRGTWWFLTRTIHSGNLPTWAQRGARPHYKKQEEQVSAHRNLLCRGLSSQ